MRKIISLTKVNQNRTILKGKNEDDQNSCDCAELFASAVNILFFFFIIYYGENGMKHAD